MSFKEIPKGFERQPDGTYSKPRARKQRKAETTEGKADSSLGSPGTNAVVEPDTGGRPLEASKNKEANPKRLLVSIESVRVRLTDPDGLCEKYHIDFLRYAGIIPNDSSKEIDLDSSQRKTEKGELERTIIEVTEL